jgi:hypothetical protein
LQYRNVLLQLRSGWRFARSHRLFLCANDVPSPDVPRRHQQNILDSPEFRIPQHLLAKILDVLALARMRSTVFQLMPCLCFPIFHLLAKGCEADHTNLAGLSQAHVSKATQEIMASRAVQRVQNPLPLIGIHIHCVPVITARSIIFDAIRNVL